jgi:hypothetical protein
MVVVGEQPSRKAARRAASLVNSWAAAHTLVVRFERSAMPKRGGRCVLGTAGTGFVTAFA